MQLFANRITDTSFDSDEVFPRSRPRRPRNWVLRLTINSPTYPTLKELQRVHAAVQQFSPTGKLILRLERLSWVRWLAELVAEAARLRKELDRWESGK